LLGVLVLVATAGCDFPKNDLVGDWAIRQNEDGADPTEDAWVEQLTFTNQDTYSHVRTIRHARQSESLSGCTEVESDSGDYTFRTSGGCESYDFSSGACQSYSTEFDYVTIAPQKGYEEISGCANPADDVPRVTYGPADSPPPAETTIDLYNDGTAEILGGLYTKEK